MSSTDDAAARGGGTAICTIVSKNYLPQARTLMQSVKRFHPECQRFVLLADHVDGYFDPHAEDFALDLSADLPIYKNSLLHFKYRLLELNTAVKPYYLADLFRRHGFEKIVYLDPDILLFDRLDPVFTALDSGNIALTPHLTDALDDNRLPNEWSILTSGVYNLGFIGVRKSTVVDTFLAWWQRKLYNDCISDIASNLFTDQRWIDLVPGMYPDVHILHDEGLNVAYWNLLHRRITQMGGQYYVNGAPLRFFHFSGFDAANPETVSRHQNRYRLDSLGGARAIFERYRENLLDQGFAETKDWPYWYGRFSSGEEIPDLGRRIVRDNLAFQAELSGAYDPENDRRIIAFLNGSFDNATVPVRISRIADHVYRTREDVQERFPDIASRDRQAFAQWFVSEGQRQYNLPPIFINPIIAELKQIEEGSVVKADDAQEMASPNPSFDSVQIQAPPRRFRAIVDRARTSVRAVVDKVDQSIAIVILVADQNDPNAIAHLSAIRSSIPAETVVIVVDQTADRGIAPPPLGSLGASVSVISLPDEIPLGQTLNLLHEWCRPHDIVVISADISLPPDWLPRLRSAALSDAAVATATTLTDGDSPLSVAWQDWELRRELVHRDIVDTDARIQSCALHTRPSVPVAGDHCLYIRRNALAALGGFVPFVTCRRDALTDFFSRAVTMGFGHVLADDVFIGRRRSPIPRATTSPIVGSRFAAAPAPSMKPDPSSPHYLAIERARAALTGYRIAIDATCINDTTNGTQVVILELLRALIAHRRDDAQITVLIADGVPRQALLGVEHLVDHVMRASDFEQSDHPRFDLIYRPFQVRGFSELAFLRRVATRCMISELDFIAYANPSYFPSSESWQFFRRVTQAAFAGVDGITYISQYVADAAGTFGVGHLIPAERQTITYLGADHAARPVHPEAPAERDRFGEQPFLLMLGANFPHKNREYAIHLLRTLATTYNWSGHLVFAGPPAPLGGVDSSETVRRTAPDLAGRVHDLNMVSENVKRWLLLHAALVLYPSIQEGFGFIPFEAAAVGTPTLTTRMTALPELLGSDVAFLDSLDPRDSAITAWTMLTDTDAALAQVERIRERMRAFTWEDVARRTWDFLLQILALPPRRVSASDLEQEQLVAGEERVNDIIERNDRYIEAIIAQKDDHIEAVIANKDAYIETVIAAKDQHIAAVIAEKDAYIETIIAQKDQMIASLKELVDERDAVLASKDDIIERNDRYIETIIAQKDGEIEAVIANKDAYIETVIAAKDQHIAALEGAVLDHERSLAQIATTQLVADETVAELHTQLREKNAHINELESRVILLERENLSWKDTAISELEMMVRRLQADKALRASQIVQRLIPLRKLHIRALRRTVAQKDNQSP